jgi:AcrR family transcriptional regulator
LAPHVPTEPTELTKPLYQALKRGRRAADGPTDEQVRRHQRLRLHGAMIELAAQRGYGAASTRELSRLAAVSKHDMYKHFATKELYFLATYEFVVRSAARRVGAAELCESSWRERLAKGFEEFAKVVVEQDNATRIALIEVLGVGEAARGRMAHSRAVFEQMLAASLDRAPGAAHMPPLFLKAIAHGVERVTRGLLLAGEQETLPPLMSQLLDWTLCLHTPAARSLLESQAAGSTGARRSSRIDNGAVRHRGEADRPCASEDRLRNGVDRLRTGEDRLRVLRATALIAARDGYALLTPAQILLVSGVSSESFEALYPRANRGLEQCFLDAHDLLWAEALLCVERAAKAKDSSESPTHAAIAALLDRVATDPVFARVAFAEVLAVGPAALERRERVLSRLAALLSASLPAGHSGAPVAMEATSGAIWGLGAHHVVHRASAQVRELGDALSYLALAPAIGTKAAFKQLRR